MQRAATLSSMSTSLRRRSPFLSLLGLLCTLSMLSGCSGDEPEAPKQTGTARPAAKRVAAEPGSPSPMEVTTFYNENNAESHNTTHATHGQQQQQPDAG